MGNVCPLRRCACATGKRTVMGTWRSAVDSSSTSTRLDGLTAILWVELPPSIDALQLHRRALAVGISLAPGHLFSADRRFSITCD